MGQVTLGWEGAGGRAAEMWLLTSGAPHQMWPHPPKHVMIHHSLFHPYKLSPGNPCEINNTLLLVVAFLCLQIAQQKPFSLTRGNFRHDGDFPADRFVSMGRTGPINATSKDDGRGKVIYLTFIVVQRS